MSKYELKIKEDYEKAGYEFLYDTIHDSNVNQIVRQAACLCGKRIKDVFAVQGECISFGKHGSSRWLIFSKKGMAY